MPQPTNQDGHHFYQNGHFGQVGPFKRLWFVISWNECNQVIIDIIVPLCHWPKCDSFQGFKGYKGPKNLFKSLKRHDFPKNPIVKKSFYNFCMKGQITWAIGNSSCISLVMWKGKVVNFRTKIRNRHWLVFKSEILILNYF